MEPENYGSTITAYQILIQHSNSTFIENTAYCDGSQSTIVAARSCEIPLDTIRSFFGLGQDDAILVKIIAINANGAGPESVTSSGTVTVQTVPTQLAVPIRGDLTTENQIEVKWTPLSSLTDMGGSVVTSYWLEWDAGSSEANWYDLTGLTQDYSNTSFIKTTGISPGSPYAFRVSAINAHGAGQASPVKTIIASSAPDMMQAPSTAIDSYTFIRVSWTAATDNSDSITEYNVAF